MSARTVRFADLLTRPAEFAPLPAPDSPTTQLETISDTSDTGSEASDTEAHTAGIGPVPVVDAAPPPPAPANAAAPLTATALLPVAPSALPPATSSGGTAAADAPPLLAGEGAAPPGSQQPLLSAPDAPPQPPLALPPAGAAATTPLPPTPPAPPAMGSPFNLPGLGEVFPVPPTNLPGFSIVPLAEAGAAAAALAGSTQALNLPGVTPLQDGSRLVAAPAAAVSLARVSQPCFAALTGEPHRRAMHAALRAASHVVKRPEAEEGYAQLAQAVRGLQEADVGACDATLSATLSSVAQLLSKRRAAATAQEATELTYLQHAQEFRAMKQDLQALAGVLRVDAQSVEEARRRRTATQAKLSPPLLDGVYALGRYLQQIEVTAKRLN